MVSKELVDMIEERNALNLKIREQMAREMSLSAMVNNGIDVDNADIVDHHKGECYGGKWISEFVPGFGDYYYETEYDGKYLHAEYRA